MWVFFFLYKEIIPHMSGKGLDFLINMGCWEGNSFYAGKQKVL
jgi:hypothetical protein